MDSIARIGHRPTPSPALQARASEAPPEPRDTLASGTGVEDTSRALRDLASRETRPPSQETPGEARPRASLVSEPPAPVALLPVPDTRQSTTYSCGASALQAVLMYYGEEYIETDLMQLLQTDPERGTHPRSIVRVARNLGFEADLREGCSISDLEEALQARQPVIVAMQAWREGDDLQKPWKDVWDSGHYVVVIGADAENVYFEEPSLLGSRGVLPREEFMERWHDVDDVRFVQSGVFIRGREPRPPAPYVHID